MAGRIAVVNHIVPALPYYFTLLDHDAGTIAALARVHLALTEIDGVFHKICLIHCPPGRLYYLVLPVIYAVTVPRIVAEGESHSR